MKRSILVVNDDGILSEGLVRLAEAASRFGRVWVAAPEHQCSGMSQKITIFQPIPVTPCAFPAPVEAAWRVGGSPADCVKAAVNCLLDEKPDYVFSGINNGINTGFDTAYSGTVGAAMEGLMKGIPAIAFSNHHNGSWEIVDRWLDDLIGELIETPPPPGEIWNVNFPGVPLDEFRGILRGRRVAPVQVYRDLFTREELPDGSFSLSNTILMIPPHLAPEDTDAYAVLTGHISVGTLRCSVL